MYIILSYILLRYVEKCNVINERYGKINLKKYTYVQKYAYLQLSNIHINICKEVLITLSEIQDIIYCVFLNITLEIKQGRKEFEYFIHENQ